MGRTRTAEIKIWVIESYEITDSGLPAMGNAHFHKTLFFFIWTNPKVWGTNGKMKTTSVFGHRTLLDGHITNNTTQPLRSGGGAPSGPPGKLIFRIWRAIRLRVKNRLWLVASQYYKRFLTHAHCMLRALLAALVGLAASSHSANTLKINFVLLWTLCAILKCKYSALRYRTICHEVSAQIRT